jgi:hypothetical protein
MPSSAGHRRAMARAFKLDCGVELAQIAIVCKTYGGLSSVRSGDVIRSQKVLIDPRGIDMLFCVIRRSMGGNASDAIARASCSSISRVSSRPTRAAENKGSSSCGCEIVKTTRGFQSAPVRGRMA